jgi:hypothetical protein
MWTVVFWITTPCRFVRGIQVSERNCRFHRTKYLKSHTHVPPIDPFTVCTDTGPSLHTHILIECWRPLMLLVVRAANCTQFPAYQICVQKFASGNRVRSAYSSYSYAQVVWQSLRSGTNLEIQSRQVHSENFSQCYYFLVNFFCVVSWRYKKETDESEMAVRRS